MSLVEFLLARIAEDEAVARAATPGPWEWDRSPGGDWGHQPPDLVTVAKKPPYSDGSVSPVGYVISSWGHDADGVEVADEDAAHLVRWDTARVLAECEVKRGAVRHLDVVGVGSHVKLDHCHRCQVLRYMGEVYADHPDYDESWRP